jgi:hypothetical protein
MSAPALEWSTKFGTRIADVIVNIGLVHFDVGEKEYQYEHIGCNLGVLKVEAIKA